MNGINQFVFNKIMSQYLVFKFQRFIELDFKIEYKVSEPVFCNTGSSSEKKKNILEPRNYHTLSLRLTH